MSDPTPPKPARTGPIDMSTLEQTQETLRNYERIVSATPDYISLVDENYVYQMVNGAYLTTSGVSYEDIVGHTISDLYGEEVFNTVIKDKIDRAFAGETVHYQTWFDFKKLGRQFLSITYSPYYDTGNTQVGVVISARDITDLKLAQQAIIDSEKKYRTIFDNIQDVYYRTDAEHKLVLLSPSALPVFGYQNLDELIGGHIGETFYYRPADREVFLEEISKHGKVAGYPVTLKRKDGSPVYVETNSNFIYGADGRFIGTEGVLRDISRRKQAEEREKKYREKLQFLSNSALQFITMPSEDEIYQFIGDSLSHFFPETVILVNAIHNDSDTTTLKAIAGVNLSFIEKVTKMLGADPYKKRYDLRPELKTLFLERKLHELTGGFRQLAGDSIPRAATKGVEKLLGIKKVYTIGTAHDKKLLAGIHLLTRKEDVVDDFDFVETFVYQAGISLHRKQLEQELVLSRQAAEQANRAKSQFLANMSHEIRTPLNAVLGFTELLDSLVKDEKQRRYLQSIKTGSKSLLTLINDILDLSKIEAGHMEIQKEPLNLRTLFDEMKQIFGLKMAQAHLDFVIKVDRGIPESLLLDEMRLRQILLNLIGNAVKFTPEGGIKLYARKIFKRKDKSSLDLIISIEDSGIGISADQQEEIFDAFRQHRGQEKKVYGGTGLGLAITRRLTEMMDGEITLKSTVGKGSCFEITLRDVAVCAVSSAPAPERLEPRQTVTFEKNLVLVVDDVPQNCELVREFLQGAHLEVIEAKDGREALMQVHQAKPALVLMDIRMPVMNGYKATRLLKEDPQLSHIPIIAVTASTMAGDREKINAAGFDGFLQKPMSRSELLREIARFLPQAAPHVPGAEPETAEGTPETVTPPAVSSENRLALLELLDKELTPRWESVGRIGSFEQIEAFGRQLEELGRQYALDMLSNYGRSLHHHAESFDVEKMRMTLKVYPDLITRIKRIS